MYQLFVDSENKTHSINPEKCIFFFFLFITIFKNLYYNGITITILLYKYTADIHTIIVEFQFKLLQHIIYYKYYKSYTDKKKTGRVRLEFL